MRNLAVTSTLALVVAAAVAQTATSAQTKATGSLIQVMRGSVFRDANLNFDVQQTDPGAPPQPHNTGPGTTTTSKKRIIYTGWQVVENAAVMLDEAVNIMLKPRMCANGIAAPVNDALYKKTAEGLWDGGARRAQSRAGEESRPGDRAGRTARRRVCRVSPGLSRS